MKRSHFLYLLLGLGLALVVGVCVLMAVLVKNHRRNTALLVEGVEACEAGEYLRAATALGRYLSHDENHEEAWKYFALSQEGLGFWPDAAAAWHRLTFLNVMEDDYRKHYLVACYRSHNYIALSQAVELLPAERREKFREFDALSHFKLHPEASATADAVAKLPLEGDMAHLIRVLQSTLPFAELEPDLAHLEESGDPVIQVEALMLDAFRCENETGDLARAEERLRRAAQITPFLCRMELANFLFRQNRFDEAAAEYQATPSKYLTDEAFLNYVEVLYCMKDAERLRELDHTLPRERQGIIALRAYLQSLLALLQKDPEKMVQNFKVAQLQRFTPVGMMLNYAVAAEDGDLSLMCQILERWEHSAAFLQKRADFLPDIRPLLAKGVAQGDWGKAAELAGYFLDMEPPDSLVLQAVLGDQLQRRQLSQELLRRALELYPQEPVFGRIALQDALAGGKPESILATYDELIARSETPTRERYGKILYLERHGLIEEAYQEFLKIREQDDSPAAAKRLLAFGMRHGHVGALELAAAVPELSAIANFEQARIRPDGLEEATRLLAAEPPLEAGLSAECPEDREILFTLAFYLGVARLFPRAIAAYEQLIPYCQDNAVFAVNLSELYAANGNRDRALKCAAEAYRRFPSLPWVKAIYGLRLAENDDFERAATMIPEDIPDEKLQNVLVSCLEKTVEDSFAQKRYMECRNTLQRLQTLRPDSPTARDYAEKLNALSPKNQTDDGN